MVLFGLLLYDPYRVLCGSTKNDFIEKIMWIEEHGSLTETSLLATIECMRC